MCWVQAPISCRTRMPDPLPELPETPVGRREPEGPSGGCSQPHTPTCPRPRVAPVSPLSSWPMGGPPLKPQAGSRDEGMQEGGQARAHPCQTRSSLSYTFPSLKSYPSQQEQNHKIVNFCKNTRTVCPKFLPRRVSWRCGARTQLPSRQVPPPASCPALPPWTPVAHQVTRHYV